MGRRGRVSGIALRIAFRSRRLSKALAPLLVPPSSCHKQLQLHHYQSIMQSRLTVSPSHPVPSRRQVTFPAGTRANCSHLSQQPVVCIQGEPDGCYSDVGRQLPSPLGAAWLQPQVRSGCEGGGLRQAVALPARRCLATATGQVRV